MLFILDENISGKLEKDLIQAGHKTRRLPQGTPDKMIAAEAQKLKAAILTHDKDFMSLPTSEMGGIILLRIHPPWSIEIAKSLLAFLSSVPILEWSGKLVLLERDGFHIRFTS